MSTARPIRVLYLINSLETGGAERQLALTVAQLDRERFEPVVCCLFRGGPFLEEVERADVPTRELGLPKGVRQAVVGARHALRELGPDLVHTAMFEANVAGRLAARRAGIAVVSHATNRYESPFRYAESAAPGWKLRSARALERWSARRSSVHVVAVGDAVARSSAAYLQVPPGRIDVIRRGFDFAALESAAALGPGSQVWPEDVSPRLLTVGRLAPQKGQHYLIEAVAAIRERRPRVHLAIAGAGPLEPRLRVLAEAIGVEDRVTFLGARRDVPGLIRSADVFVLPSLWEGAAGTLVEAMGLGAPVSVTDDDALREIAGDAAAYFPPKDPRGIAEAVEAICTDPEAAWARARRAVPRVRAAHDIATNTRALEGLYERIVGAADFGKDV